MKRNGARNGAAVFIFITVLLDMLAFGMVGPVLPKLIAGFVGNDYAHAAQIIGIFATVWALMQFFCSPLLGMISDRVGRRPVILIANAVSVLDFAIMALAPNLWWLFVGRIVSGMASANSLPRRRYIADVTPPENRAKAFGLIGAAFGLGFVLGPAIGGAVGVLNPRLAFWARGSRRTHQHVYGLFVLPESLPSEKRTRRLEWRAPIRSARCACCVPIANFRFECDELHRQRRARSLSKHLGDLLHRSVRLEHRPNRSDARAHRRRRRNQSGHDGGTGRCQTWRTQNIAGEPCHLGRRIGAHRDADNGIRVSRCCGDRLAAHVPMPRRKP